MEEKDFQVEKIGSCVVITMDLGENRLNNNFVRALNKALDEVEG
jgi:enoyl-CoA hydratase/carnithine racemase